MRADLRWSLAVIREEDATLVRVVDCDGGLIPSGLLSPWVFG